MSAQKKRKPEGLKVVVKWIAGNMMYFRWFKRDKAAMDFVTELEYEGVDPAMIRVMSK